VLSVCQPSLDVPFRFCVMIGEPFSKLPGRKLTAADFALWWRSRWL